MLGALSFILAGCHASLVGKGPLTPWRSSGDDLESEPSLIIGGVFLVDGQPQALARYDHAAER